MRHSKLWNSFATCSTKQIWFSNSLESAFAESPHTSFMRSFILQKVPQHKLM